MTFLVIASNAFYNMKKIMGHVYRNASHLRTTCFVGSDLQV